MHIRQTRIGLVVFGAGRLGQRHDADVHDTLMRRECEHDGDQEIVTLSGNGGLNYSPNGQFEICSKGRQRPTPSVTP